MTSGICNPLLLGSGGLSSTVADSARSVPARHVHLPPESLFHGQVQHGENVLRPVGKPAERCSWDPKVVSGFAKRENFHILCVTSPHILTQPRPCMSQNTDIIPCRSRPGDTQSNTLYTVQNYLLLNSITKLLLLITFVIPEARVLQGEVLSCEVP